MATKALVVSAANVVRLSTAAPRKIDNYRSKEQRKAALSLRENSPFHDRYIAPHVREAMLDARLINDVMVTPELLIASALLALADTETRAKVAAQLVPGAVCGNKAHNQALAIMRRQRQCLGDQFAFQAAQHIVEEEGY